MVKTFRKLAALTAAVAIVSSFAVCASAEVTVNTTTSYVDADTISVTAVVSDGEGTELNDAQVTYFATNAGATATGGIVYMDQKAAENGVATFTFKTDADYLESAVKVGYTGATEAVESIIPICYTLSVTDGAANSVSTQIAKNADPNGTYTMAYTPATGKYVSALTVTGGTATIVTSSASSLTFTLTGLAAATGDITITATESDINAGSEVGSVIRAGGIVAGADNNDTVTDEGGLPDEYKAEEGNRKLTVIGKVENLPDGVEYGVIVAESIDENAYQLPAERFFKALGKNDDGYFAVQLIDTADNASATFIKAGTTYQTAVYYKYGNVYKIVKGNTVTITAQ